MHVQWRVTCRDEFELSNSSSDVDNDIDSCIEKFRLKKLITLWDHMSDPRLGGSGAGWLLRDVKLL